MTLAFSGDSNVTPQSAGDLHTVEHPQPSLPAVGTASELKTSDIVPESADGKSFVAPNQLIIDHAKSPQSSLPSIGVFLSKSCTIPLVWCDFEQIKKTVELQAQQDNNDPTEGVGKQPTKPVMAGNSNNDKNEPVNTTEPVGVPNKAEVHTSNRKRTVIDYKKFLEEYADEPPSLPKKRQELDLKCKPSKSQIAAEKYNRSKFVTKPTHLPKPICRRKGERSNNINICSL